LTISRPHGLRGGSLQPLGFLVRQATPADVGALVRMKMALAASEKAELAVRSTAQDWPRDGFGSNARFTAFIAEHESAGIGIITSSERYYTGWPEPTIYVDIFVEPGYRRRGTARALLGRVAALAVARGSPMIELTVCDDNPARNLYRCCGFQRVGHCVNYVAGLPTLAKLTAESEVELGRLAG
jgi:GNAT superfamily N-acetyltransferase